MKKSIQLPIQVRAYTIGDQSVFEVYVPPDSLNQWCLCLQLLHEELVDGCLFFFPQYKMNFEVQCGKSSTYKIDGNKYIVILTTQDLDCLRFFYLKYFKNGYSDVDHVDIEDVVNKGGYLTFYTSEYAAPVSADEARKRLGID